MNISGQKFSVVTIVPNILDMATFCNLFQQHTNNDVDNEA